MDINQYDWVTVKGKPDFWRGTFRRSIVLFPLFAFATYVVVSFAYGGQRIFNKEQAVAILETIMIITMAVINSIWHTLIQAAPDKLIHYKVSAEGISREKKKISLEALRNPTIEAMLAKHALPYQQWRRPLPPDVSHLELTFQTNQGKIVMVFPGEYERQKCIRTLQEYLHPTPIVEVATPSPIAN